MNQISLFYFYISVALACKSSKSIEV